MYGLLVCWKGSTWSSISSRPASVQPIRSESALHENTLRLFAAPALVQACKDPLEDRLLAIRPSPTCTSNPSSASCSSSAILYYLKRHKGSSLGQVVHFVQFDSTDPANYVRVARWIMFSAQGRTEQLHSNWAFADALTYYHSAVCKIASQEKLQPPAWPHRPILT